MLHTRRLSMRGGTDTYSVLQQLLGVVNCTDDSCSPTASTAMRVTAGLLVEGSGGHTAFSNKNISKTHSLASHTLDSAGSHNGPPAPGGSSTWLHINFHLTTALLQARGHNSSASHILLLWCPGVHSVLGLSCSCYHWPAVTYLLSCSPAIPVAQRTRLSLGLPRRGWRLQSCTGCATHPHGRSASRKAGRSRERPPTCSGCRWECCRLAGSSEPHR